MGLLLFYKNFLKYFVENFVLRVLTSDFIYYIMILHF